MSSRSERVNELIQEHATLTKAQRKAPDKGDSEQRLTAIRQELVRILQTRKP